MTNPLFSILVAEYNNEKFFKEFYNSIIAQTYTNWEVIIIDDCSTNEGSLDKIKAIIGNDDRFKIYVNDKNMGCGFTKKRCVELANGEICAFIDPDDAITEDAIEIMVKTHLQNPDIGLAYSNRWMCDSELKPYEEFNVCQVENNDKQFFNLGGIIGHLAAFKTSFYKQVKEIDPDLKVAIDQDLYLNLYDIAPVKHIDKLLYYYRIHNRGISTLKNEDKAFFGHWVIIINKGKERNIDITDLFFQNFIRTQHLKRDTQALALGLKIRESRLYKLFNRIKYKFQK